MFFYYGVLTHIDDKLHLTVDSNFLEMLRKYKIDDYAVRLPLSGDRSRVSVLPPRICKKPALDPYMIGLIGKRVKFTFAASKYAINDNGAQIHGYKFILHDIHADQ